MTEYVVKARLDGDASGLKAAAGEGKAALDSMGTAATETGKQASAVEKPMLHLGRVFSEVSMGARAQSVAMKEAAQAQGLTKESSVALGATMRSTTAAASAQAGQMRGTAGAQKQAEAAASSLGNTLRSATQEFVQSAAGAAGLGQNVAQTGVSAGKFGAVIGTVAGAVGGILGAAVGSAITGLVSLAASFFDSGEDAKKAAKGADIHKMSLEDLKKAIDDENVALGKAIQTSRQAEEASLRAAEAKRNEVRDRRANIVAMIEEAKEQQQRSFDLLSRPTNVAGAESGAAFAAYQAAESRLKKLEADLAKANTAFKAAEQGVTLSSVPILQRNSAARLDPKTKADEEYQQGIRRLNQQLDIAVRAGSDRTLAERTYSLALDRLSKAHERELKTIQDREQRARQVDRETGRTVAFLSPVNGDVSSGFGARKAPKAGASTFHQGIDFAVPTGTAVRAPAVGTVEAVGFDPKLGKYVVIDHGAGTKTKFGHLSDTSAVRVGSQLGTGDVFARSGNTGNSTGAHLHYSVIQGGKYVDPRKGRFKADAGDAALDTESDIARGQSAIAREAKRAADEADRALEELQRELGATIGAFDPARAAADKYADTLERIARLEKAGKLTSGEADQYRRAAAFTNMESEAKAAAAKEAATLSNFSESFQKATDRPLVDLSYRAQDVMKAAGVKGAEAFRDEGMAAAEAVARLFGGKIGDAAGDAFAILGGLKSGNFNSVGGPLGSIMTLLGGERRPGDKPDPFNEGLREFAKPLKLGLKEVVTKIGDTFKIGGDFEKTLGHVAGGAALGAVVGPAVTKLLGIRGSKTGATIGGAVGAAAGAASGIPGGQQIGAILGSIQGSIIGGLFKKPKTGSATITNTTGDAVLGGNNAESKASAATMGKNIQGTLAQIAQSLGGQLGAFSVSIGMKDGNFRVDPTGKGIVKTKQGAKDFGKDQAAAEAAALADAIADGAVIGLSEKVQAALRSSTDIDRALREALKVDELETLLAGVGGPLTKQIKDFDRQAAERVRIAKQYGFDVLKVEKLNAEERVKLIDQILGSRIAPLKDLIASIDFGDLFEGSIVDQLAKLKGESAKARADAEAGLDGAAERFADLERSIIDKTMEGFGTAGPELANARQEARSAAERIIELENARVKAAQDATKETNNQLSELNDQASEQNVILKRIEAAIGAIGFGGGGGGGRYEGASARFEANLNL